MMAVRELTDSINSVSVITGRRRKRAGFGKGVSMKLFTYGIDIGFRHCDPAGIVFYPRYFEMMNDAIEIFFRDVVKWPFSQMHAVDRRGIPAVSINLNFAAPGRLGDRLDWQMRVIRLGKSSAVIGHQAKIGDVDVLSGDTTIVHTDLDRMSALVWTDDVRTVLAHYCDDGEGD